MKIPPTGHVRAESKTAGCPAGHFSKKREKWRTPSYLVSIFKDNPRYTFHADVAHPPVTIVVFYVNARRLILRQQRHPPRLPRYTPAIPAAVLHLTSLEP